jgi:hypothetical protein
MVGFDNGKEVGERVALESGRYAAVDLESGL